MCPFTKRFPYPIIYLSVNRNMTDVTSGTETFPVFSSFRATKSLVFYVVYHIIWYVFLSFFAIITLPSVFLFTAPDCHCGIFPYTMYFCFLLWYPMFSIVIHPSQQVRHFFFCWNFIRIVWSYFNPSRNRSVSHQQLLFVCGVTLSQAYLIKRIASLDMMLCCFFWHQGDRLIVSFEISDNYLSSE